MQFARRGHETQRLDVMQLLLLSDPAVVSSRHSSLPLCSFRCIKKKKTVWQHFVRCCNYQRKRGAEAPAPLHRCTITYRTSLLPASWNQSGLWTRQLRVARYGWLHHCVAVQSPSVTAQLHGASYTADKRDAHMCPLSCLLSSCFVFLWAANHPVLSQSREGGRLTWL